MRLHDNQMKITFSKISNTQHRLRCERKDGSIEEALLETKSFLVHDFTHLAYEMEAGLKDAFWGRVAASGTFLGLREPMADAMAHLDDELVQTERIVGPLQMFMQNRTDAAQVVSGMRQASIALGVSLPAFLDVDFLLRAKERYRKLIGEWNALPFGEGMEVEWEG